MMRECGIVSFLECNLLFFNYQGDTFASVCKVVSQKYFAKISVLILEKEREGDAKQYISEC